MTTVIQTDIVIAVRVTTTLQPHELGSDILARLESDAVLAQAQLHKSIESGQRADVVDYTEGGWSVMQRELVPK